MDIQSHLIFTNKIFERNWKTNKYYEQILSDEDRSMNEWSVLKWEEEHLIQSDNGNETGLKNKSFPAFMRLIK